MRSHLESTYMSTATPTKPAAKSASLKAATGKASTAVAVKKPNAGSIVSIQEQIKAQMEGLKDRVAPPTGIKIRATQDKKWVLPDGTQSAGSLELIVVDFLAVHEFYETAFDKDNIVPPGCFAVGMDPKKMFPSANAPNKQSDDCQSCPNNQFGSNGRGKACGNGRLLAVLPADCDENTPIWLLQPSATAIKGFDNFVATVARTFQTMPVGVTVTVSFDENETYAKMVFSDPRPNENLAVAFSRQGEARELLNAPRDVSGYVPVSKAPARKAGVARR